MAWQLVETSIYSLALSFPPCLQNSAEGGPTLGTVIGLLWPSRSGLYYTKRLYEVRALLAFVESSGLQPAECFQAPSRTHGLVAGVTSWLRETIGFVRTVSLQETLIKGHEDQL